MLENYGILSLVPVLVVIVLVLVTKRTALSLLAGTIVGAVMLYGFAFPLPWMELVYGVLGSRLWCWLFLVCGFFGSLVALFEESGGIYGFTALALKLCRGEKRTQLGVWLLSVIVFIDDWLAILAVGTAMRQSTDRARVPREMLAFLVSAASCSLCVLVPISSWGVFMTSQMVASGLCTTETGMATYLQTVPYMFYPILMLLCSLLFALGVLPKFGPMRRADALFKAAPLEERAEAAAASGRKPNVLNFLLPLLLITVITILTGEILYGTLACLVFCALLYLPQRLMTFSRFMETVKSGFQNMLGVLAIVTSAFILRDLNDLLGMSDYVIDIAQGNIPPALLPVVVFLLISALSFAAGNFWGIGAIAFPAIIPIAHALGGNIFLISGAIISATVASCNACFYGSEATLACSSTQIDNIQYAKTIIPLLSIPYLLCALFYPVAGFVLV